MTSKKKKPIRKKSHWCLDAPPRNNHNKCAGKVQQVINKKTLSLNDDNYKTYTCQCSCHE